MNIKEFAQYVMDTVQDSAENNRLFKTIKTAEKAIALKKKQNYQDFLFEDSDSYFFIIGFIGYLFPHIS